VLKTCFLALQNFKGEILVNINIEIAEELHKKIKLASIVQDLTLKDYIIHVLEKKSKECKTKIG